MDKNKAEQIMMNTKLIKRTFKDEYKKSMNVKKIAIDVIAIFISFIISDYLEDLFQINNEIYTYIVYFILILIFIIISNKLYDFITIRNIKNNKI